MENIDMTMVKIFVILVVLSIYFMVHNHPHNHKLDEPQYHTHGPDGHPYFVTPDEPSRGD